MTCLIKEEKLKLNPSKKQISFLQTDRDGESSKKETIAEVS